MTVSQVAGAGRAVSRRLQGQPALTVPGRSDAPRVRAREMDAGADAAAVPRPARSTLVDAHVIDACQRGDAEAFRVLFEAYKTRVYSIALHFTGESAAAHDVSQQVFVTVYTALARFRRESVFDTWLYRIIVNACLHEHRRRRRFVPLGDVTQSRLETGDPSLEHDFLRRERIDAVRRAIATLSPRLRLPLVLRHLEELSYQEIGDVLGCSAGTVASRLNRARTSLATRLGHLKGN